MAISKEEVRLECLKLAHARISGSRANDTESLLDMAEKLVNYVNNSGVSKRSPAPKPAGGKGQTGEPDPTE